MQPEALRWPDLSPIRLSIVVPTFNECLNVPELLDRLNGLFRSESWEIIFVDDDSPDGTADLVRAVARTDPRVRCLQRIGRRGLSSACIEGMLAASAETIAVMDADLQHDESVLPKMLDAIERGGADVAVGTRYAPGGGLGDWKASRRFMSRLATKASRAILHQPVSDPMSGFFMLRRAVLDSTVRSLSGLGFKILLDILSSARAPLRIAEVPYTFRNRHAGESKLDGTVVWEYGMLLAEKLFGRVLPARFLAFSIVGGLGVFIHMAVLSLLLKFLESGFAAAQASAAVVAMIFNFWLNNLLTYRDRKLRGRSWVRGLFSFMLACSVGALANVGVASYLFEHGTYWALAGLAGILVGAVWNYAITRLCTWGKNTGRA